MNTYNSKLQTNNATIQELINIVNNLPEVSDDKDLNDFIENDVLNKYIFDNVTKIRTNGFAYCTNLTTATFPNCINIGNEAFYDCDNLTTASFPNCTNIGVSAFYWCSKLTTVTFPNCTNIGNKAFHNCTNLSTISFPNCTNIGASAFYACYNLSSFTLGASIVCTLAHSNALGFTPFAGYSSYFSGTPVIYVPSALLENYKTATNWTYFSKYMVGY